MQNGHTTSSEMGMPLDPPADSEEAPAVDLAAWAAGEVEYPFDQVQRACDELVLQAVDEFVKERFPIMVTNPRDAVRFIVQEGLIAEDETRQDLDE